MLLAQRNGLSELSMTRSTPIMSVSRQRRASNTALSTQAACVVDGGCGQSQDDVAGASRRCRRGPAARRRPPPWAKQIFSDPGMPSAPERISDSMPSWRFGGHTPARAASIASCGPSFGPPIMSHGRTSSGMFLWAQWIRTAPASSSSRSRSPTWLPDLHADAAGGHRAVYLPAGRGPCPGSGTWASAFNREARGRNSQHVFVHAAPSRPGCRPGGRTSPAWRRSPAAQRPRVEFGDAAGPSAAWDATGSACRRA